MFLRNRDALENEGKYWHEILGGGPEFFFRGLLISKFCNDPDFKRKIDYVDELFYPNVSKEWIPYYEALKKRLI